MRILDRDLQRIATAAFDRRHWGALWRMFRVFERPVTAMARYVSNSGRYPWRPRLRTPMGVVSPELSSYHDLLTVNEVFCRLDYGDARHVRSVVDIGANVGLASLFFLTRSPDVRVWCCEPDPDNLRKLRRTLAGHLDRVEIIPKAVTVEEVESVRFAAAGRYGHINEAGGLEVPAISVGALLHAVARQAEHIDLVKIDTEGTELELVRALPTDVPISAVVYEDSHGRTQWRG